MARGPLYPGSTGDPRLSPGPETRGRDGPQDLQPQVAGPVASPGPWLVAAVAILMGVAVFLWLSSHRGSGRVTPEASQVVSTSTPLSAPPPPPELAALATQTPAPVPLIAPPTTPATSSALQPVPPPQTPTPAETGRAPVMVVDFSPPGTAEPHPTGASKAPAATGDAASQGLNADERFVARIESSSEPARASATLLHNQATLIPQGTTIPAVLETALNSDLPGYARAVVSRDVRSFDASTVLIPRGSRVIGEYRSAVAQGQTRAFVIWTRILRPDGASIMIGSGGGDTLGRAGLAGKVDTHFLEEFSGAILLTALNAGATAVAGVPSTEVVIGSAGSGAAGNLAGPLSAFAPVAIPPTIKVAQGTPVLIFVQRDLDFTAVEASAK